MRSSNGWQKVRYWHAADMPLAATNVGFGGKQTSQLMAYYVCF